MGKSAVSIFTRICAGLHLGLHKILDFWEKLNRIRALPAYPQMVVERNEWSDDGWNTCHAGM